MNYLRPASVLGLPRQQKLRSAATAFDLQPRMKSLDGVATRVIAGTSHWTVLLFLYWPRQRWRAGLWTSCCDVKCVVPVNSISEDLFSGMWRGNDKQGSGVGV